jgi:hypothetical protein
MAITYRVAGSYYTDLTDLLSDGWTEDRLVEIQTEDGKVVAGTPTIAALRAEYQSAKPSLAKLHRVAARANEGYASRTESGLRYAVALVTEDEPGWIAFTYTSDLETAKVVADNLNKSHGISEDDALNIEISSMRAGRVR